MPFKRDMVKLWQKISFIGIDNTIDEVEKKSILFINRMSALFMVLCLLSLFINLLLHTYLFIPILSIATALLALSYLTTLKRLFLFSKINTLGVVMVVLLYMSFNGGYGSGLEYYFLSIIASLVFIFQQKPFIYLFLVLSILCLIVIKLYGEHFAVPLSLPHKVFYVFNSFCSCILVLLAMFVYRNISNKREQELHDKKAIIEEKNFQLEELNKQLDSFSYSVAHDLKSPLRSVEGFSTILEKKYIDKILDEDKELFLHIKSSAMQMKNLIENLLIFSKSAKKELDLNIVHLNELVQEIIQKNNFLQGKHHIHITVDTLPNTRADRILLGQVYENLLSNALKYSKEKKEVQIYFGAYTEKEKNIYFVKDNGIGFDMQYADKLFNPFQRLHSQTQYEGSGVGLSIVKSIIERHGGSVWAEAKKGEGATFFFSIPTTTNS